MERANETRPFFCDLEDPKEVVFQMWMKMQTLGTVIVFLHCCPELLVSKSHYLLQAKNSMPKKVTDPFSNRTTGEYILFLFDSLAPCTGKSGWLLATWTPSETMMIIFKIPNKQQGKRITI